MIHLSNNRINGSSNNRTSNRPFIPSGVPPTILTKTTGVSDLRGPVENKSKNKFVRFYYEYVCRAFLFLQIFPSVFLPFFFASEPPGGRFTFHLTPLLATSPLDYLAIGPPRNLLFQCQFPHRFSIACWRTFVPPQFQKWSPK